jgi:hypothetical protein
MKKYCWIESSLAQAAMASGSACDWSNPGSQRYTGTVESALARYKDIPASARAELADRMARHAYDDKVSIDARKEIQKRQAH